MTLESNVRSLKSLGVPRETYGGLLSSILMIKLPQEFRLVITREMGNDDWQLDQLLAIFKRELEARERAGAPSVNGNQSLPPKPPNKNKRDQGNSNCTSSERSFEEVWKMFCVPSEGSHKPQLSIQVQMS